MNTPNEGRLSGEQSCDASNAICRAFFFGALVGFIVAVYLTAAIFLAHMAHHDRMFHRPKTVEKGGGN